MRITPIYHGAAEVLKSIFLVQLCASPSFFFCAFLKLEKIFFNLEHLTTFKGFTFFVAYKQPQHKQPFQNLYFFVTPFDLL